MRTNPPSRARGWLAVAALLGATLAPAAANEAEVLQQLAHLRGIKPTKDQKALDAINGRLDAAWRWLGDHKAEALPVVRRELTAALARPSADPFFVLDAGHLLFTLGGKAEERLALQALAKIDPAAEIIRYNFQELVEFAHALARAGSPQVRPQLDRIFLLNETGLEFFRAPHVVKLDATALCVILYGATGPDAEAHLVRAMEGHPALRPRALEVLGWLGSAASTPRVKAVLEANGDLDTVTRAVKFLMSLGGPAGRDAVLAAAPANLDDKARDYLQQIRPDVRRVSAQTLLETVQQLDSPSAKSTFTDEQLRAQLDKMEAANGVDNETNPSAIVRSKLPRAALLEQLKRIRSRTLHRLDQHALEDVEITNLLINTLQFQP